MRQENGVLLNIVDEEGRPDRSISLADVAIERRTNTLNMSVSEVVDQLASPCSRRLTQVEDVLQVFISLAQNIIFVVQAIPEPKLVAAIEKCKPK